VERERAAHCDEPFSILQYADPRQLVVSALLVAYPDDERLIKAKALLDTLPAIVDKAGEDASRG
jgi:hypothetical protein